MWRDRTSLFLSYRSTYTHPSKRRRYEDDPGFGQSTAFSAPAGEETRGLMTAEPGDAVIEMDVLPPRWLDIQEEVNSQLQTIQLKIPQLDKLHSKHILPGFDDEDVKAREEIEIEKLTQDITRGFQICQVAIKKIEKVVKDGQRQQGSHKISRGEEVMAGNVRVALASRVQEVSAVFRKKQSVYLEKLRKLNGMETPLFTGIPAGQRFATPNSAIGNPATDPALLDADTDRSIGQAVVLQSQLSQRQLRHQNNDSVIAQREQEINDIAKGIIELSDVFRELQTMVIDQGTMLDRIDYNVERMAVDVKGAEKELVVATGYQKKTTKRKIILLLILLVVGMFVLLLVKPKRDSRAVDSTPPQVQPIQVDPP